MGFSGVQKSILFLPRKDGIGTNLSQNLEFLNDPAGYAPLAGRKLSAVYRGCFWRFFPSKERSMPCLAGHAQQGNSFKKLTSINFQGELWEKRSAVARRSTVPETV
jgi:hypothetical protein